MRRRDLAIVVFFTIFSVIPFINNAYHIDETYFLAVARHILIDPWHPLDFPLNWFGSEVQASSINVHPMLLPYILALGLKLTGAIEWRLRLFCLPFDLMAAASLYMLAARFLKRPLLPTLVILSCPAYVLNMQHLMGEKWIGAFGFTGLVALARSWEERSSTWFWGSAALLALAVLSKLTAVFLLVPAVIYALGKKVPPARIAAYVAVVMAPLFLWAAANQGSSIFRVQSLVEGVFGIRALSPLNFCHRLRSVLAFCAGSLVFPIIWPFLLDQHRRPALIRAGGALAAAVLLFLPALDSRAVSWADRGLGIFLAGSALVCLRRVCGSKSRGDGNFWLSWLFSVIAIQLFAYWSVATRFTLFMAPPVVFLGAAQLEESKRAPQVFGMAMAIAMALTAGLALVDKRYSSAQREVANLVSRRYAAPGRKIWFTGHWGFQYYMERIGAHGIDWARGDFWNMRSGDVFVSPTVNTNLIRSLGTVTPGLHALPIEPGQPARLAEFSMLRVSEPIPLRLIGWGGRQAGFYSDVSGFLPFAIGREPLDEFVVAQLR